MPQKERVSSLKQDIPAVFLALQAEDTPFPAKILALLTVVYALSLIDLVPDFIPVLGHLDDVLLLPAMVALTVKLIPEEIFQRCRQEAEGIWKDGKPKRWHHAIPIVFLWLVILAMIIKAVL